MAVAIPCPKCKSVMRSAAPVPAGRKVKCPKCNAVFAAPANGTAPARPASATSGSKPGMASPTSGSKPGVAPTRPSATGQARPRPAASGSALRPVDDFALIAASAAPPPVPVKKRPKRGGKLKLIFSLLLLLGLAGGGYWLYGLATHRPGASSASSAAAAAPTTASAPVTIAKSSDNPLDYLPADSSVIAGVDPASLLQVPLFQANLPAVLAAPPIDMVTAELKRLTGRAPDELERCLIAGTGDLSNGNRPTSVVIVARTKTPVDDKQLSQLPDVITTKKGKNRPFTTLRSSALTQAYETRACCAPTDRLIVVALGSEPVVEAAMDRLATASALPAELKPLLRQVETSHLWVIQPLDAVMRQQVESAGALAPALDGIAKTLAKSKAAAIWVSADAKEIALSAGVLCPDPTVAKDLAGSLGEMWNQTKTPVQTMLQPTIKELPGDLRDVIADVFRSGAITANGEVAQASIHLTMAPLEGLAKAVKAVGPGTLLASIEQARQKGGLTGMAAPAAAGGENEMALLTQINKAREDEELPPLKPDAKLFQAAANLAKIAAKDANFEAVTPDEVVAAIKAAGAAPAQHYNFAITPGKEKYDPEVTVKAWMNDDNNKNKLMHKDFNTCGLGVVAGAGDEVFVVVIFTRR